MGLYSGMQRSCSTYDGKAEPQNQAAPQPPLPDPNNYFIRTHEQIGMFLIVMVRYPNCTNYEGLKILVYRNVTLEQLQKQKHLDPHFSSNADFHSPIARFEPTARGTFYAQCLCHTLSKEKVQSDAKKWLMALEEED